VRQAAPDQALRELTTSDVRCACDVLRTVYDATEGVDGRVSIEVDPRFAYDPERTVAEARTLWWLVDRPNLFVKIPAVKQGLPAISGCLAEGISINVTLIFSLARYAEVIEAFLTGLEGARAAGRDLSGVASVASFFVSCVDTEVDRRLDKIGTGRAAALRGKAAIANARLAYQRYEESVSTDRWKSLAAAGARLQRPLWASTSVKDPAYEDTRYVTGLVAPDVVNTMSEATLNAVADHGRIPDDSIHGTYNQSRDALCELAAIGIDYHDVVQVLEDQGVGAFKKLIENSAIPYSIVHATQFFEFVRRMADEAIDGSTVRFAPVVFQPIPGDDVAQAVGKIAAGSPLNRGKSRSPHPSSSGWTSSSGAPWPCVTIRERWSRTRTRATSEPSLASEPCCRAPTRFSARSATATGRAEPRPGSNTSPKEKR
jgi:transaldolase